MKSTTYIKIDVIERILDAAKKANSIIYLCIAFNELCLEFKPAEEVRDWFEKWILDTGKELDENYEYKYAWSKRIFMSLTKLTYVEWTKVVDVKGKKYIKVTTEEKIEILEELLIELKLNLKK